MSVAYIDTSILVAIEFKQLKADECADKISQFSEIVSSNLLEAEFLAACKREQHEPSKQILSEVHWILPGRPLTRELNTVLKRGYLRGADLHHLGTAIYLANSISDVTFVTLDETQKKLAAIIGFRV